MPPRGSVAPSPACGPGGAVPRRPSPQSMRLPVAQCSLGPVSGLHAAVRLCSRSVCRVRRAREPRLLRGARSCPFRGDCVAGSRAAALSVPSSARGRPHARATRRGKWLAPRCAVRLSRRLPCEHFLTRTRELQVMPSPSRSLVSGTCSECLLRAVRPLASSLLLLAPLRAAGARWARRNQPARRAAH